jgi:opacity protein-like surface antigen
MRKKFLYLLLFFGFITCSSHASLAAPHYFDYTTYGAPTVILLKPYSKNLRKLVPSNSHLGYIIGIRGGGSLDNRLFFELDYSYQHADLNDSRRQGHAVKKNFFHAWSYLINNIYYFQPIRGLSPYLGIGIGYRKSTMTLYRYTLDYSLHSKAKFVDYAPAYQLLGGIKYPLFDTTDLALEALARHGVKKSFILSLQLGLSLIHRF